MSEGEPVQIEHAVCVRHEGRAAEALCDRCREPACLDCAVPVRGRVLCVRCATEEVGAPLVVAAEVPDRRSLHAWAFAAFALGLAASIPPWHSFGILTAVLSAWGSAGGALAPIAAGSLAAGVVTAGWSWKRPSRGATPLLYVALGFLGSGAAGLELLTAPPFVSPGPAPFVALGAALGALVVGMSGVYRRRRARRAGASPSP